MSIRIDNGRPPAKTRELASQAREIIRFNDERNLFDDFDTPPIITRDLNARDATPAEQESLERMPEVVRSIDQHGVRLGEALPDMLRRAKTKYFLNLARCQFF